MHLLRLDEPAFPLALLTKRVCIHVPVTDAFPCPSIPALGCRVPVILFVPLVLFSLMFLTEPAIRQLRTAGVGTRPLWFPWHRLTSFGHRKSPAGFLSQGWCSSYILLILLYHSVHMGILGQTWTFQAHSYRDRVFRQDHVLQCLPMPSADCSCISMKLISNLLPGIIVDVAVF